MSIFFSTHLYSLGWMLGVEEAKEEFTRQCQAPDNDSLSCVHTLSRLRTIDDCQVWFDAGSTRLAHSRSRAFHDFLNSGCEVWFTCDDDCEADTDTLRSMVEAVKGAPAICIAPCLTRGSNNEVSVPLDLPLVLSTRALASGALLVRANAAGLGMTALNRYACIRIAQHNEDLRYVDNDGVARLAVFLEGIRPSDRRWLGEDLAFFYRTPTDVTIEALLTGRTMHAGRSLNLERIRLAVLGELSQKTMQICPPGTPENKP